MSRQVPKHSRDNTNNVIGSVGKYPAIGLLRIPERERNIDRAIPSFSELPA